MSARTTVALAFLALGLVACSSPEAARSRGGGRGADPNNRSTIVQMHAGSRMFYDTPCLLPDDKCTAPPPASGLPGDFPEPKRARPPRT